MDAFFCSVEQRNNPELRGKPIAVGGSKQRGVVAAASYEARKFGVKSAMPSQTAAKLCPGLIFVKPNFEDYKTVSNEIRSIFKRYTSLIEPLSLDEAFLDVSELPEGFESATAVAEQIRQEIKAELNLTASAGVSYNKFLAKMASDQNKPDGIFIITPARSKEFLSQLKIKEFFGIGKVTAAKFQKMGILYGSDLLKIPLITLKQHFGKSAKGYYNLVRGIDLRTIKTSKERKSIGSERTFLNDLDNFEDLSESLKLIAENIERRCIKANKKGRTITLKIKYGDFSQITRSITDDDFKCDKELIFKQSYKLLAKTPDLNRGIRLLGISISNFESKEKNEFEQLKFPF